MPPLFPAFFNGLIAEPCNLFNLSLVTEKDV